MIKGSHNTFTYLSPQQWWLKPFSFIARCQNKPLYKQIEEGVTVFDLRLRKDKQGDWLLAHNVFIYEKGEMAIKLLLGWLNCKAKSLNTSIYVRILHEVRNKRQAVYSSSEDFEKMCKTLCKSFPNIKFFGGQRTMDWQQDYLFPAKNNIEYIEKHASVIWPKWFHWWPWLYAKLNNKYNIEKYKEQNITMFYDFV